MTQNHEPFELVSLIYALLQSEQRKRCTKFRLHLIHFEVLEFLSKSKKKTNTPAILADHFGMTRGTISQSIILLEKKNYIEKTQDIVDKRIVHIHLTTLGKSTFQKAKNGQLINQASKTLLAQNQMQATQQALTELLQRVEHSCYKYDFKKNLDKKQFTTTSNDSIDLIDNIANLIRMQERMACIANKVQLVHYFILDYLSHCNRYSDTLLAVTHYLGMTRGTVSQSTSFLVEKNFIKKTQDKADKRIFHIQLTEQGYSLLQSIKPTAIFDQVCNQLHLKSSFEQTCNQLRILLTTLQQANNSNYFGICNTCKHFQVQNTGQFCLMIQEQISEQQKYKLCIEHSCE